MSSEFSIGGISFFVWTETLLVTSNTVQCSGSTLEASVIVAQGTAEMTKKVVSISNFHL
jgi:hypothetical protein